MDKGVLFALAMLLYSAESHPLCLDSTGPTEEKRSEMKFCSEIIDPSNPDGACCTYQQELDVKAKLYDVYNLSPECQVYQRQVACVSCHPYAVHLLAHNGGVLGMSHAFCDEYYNACKDNVSLSSDYCEKYATDDFYAYPLTSEAVASNMTPFFNNIANGLPNGLLGAYMRPDKNSWWMVDQSGLVVEADNDPNCTYTKTVLNIKEKIIYRGELGLLGLVFSPDFATSRRFYVNYISNEMKTTIARYQLTENDADRTKSTEQIILSFSQPYENHNGGTLLFSPKDISEPTGRNFYDLYITSGDGGGGNDPNNNSQNLNSFLGKILRIRISTDYSRVGYDIPGDNINKEVWAYGLRNPWKCSFDRTKLSYPEMWCGDVGEISIEEVSFIHAGGNYGWKNFEGTKHNAGNYIDYIAPLFQYCHKGYTDSERCNGVPFTGESITGGFIYRGKQFASTLTGQYIFADYQTGGVHRLYWENGTWHPAVIHSGVGFHIASLAEDNEGEIYIVGRNAEKNLYALPINLNADDNTVTIKNSADQPLLNPASTSDPTCQNGIKNSGGTVCCPSSCGGCGGGGCDLLSGGPQNCCSSGVTATGRSCNDNRSPCIIDPTGMATTAVSAPLVTNTQPTGAVSDPTCASGIPNSENSICCPKSCGGCGGYGCQERPGGASDCCSSGVKLGGRSCSSSMPPCVMDGNAPQQVQQPAANITTDPKCQSGLLNDAKSACCPKSCGKCGGYGCDKSPGGRNSCCTSGVMESGRKCSATMAPCIL